MWVIAKFGLTFLFLASLLDISETQNGVQKPPNQTKPKNQTKPTQQNTKEGFNGTEAIYRVSKGQISYFFSGNSTGHRHLPPYLDLDLVQYNNV